MIKEHGAVKLEREHSLAQVIYNSTSYTKGVLQDGIKKGIVEWITE
ncbi:hypothetical protein [Candidatus Bandiella euplotis]|nr:hypothetical protein [Candidatus Bandiella woodruffii]